MNAQSTRMCSTMANNTVRIRRKNHPRAEFPRGISVSRRFTRNARITSDRISLHTMVSGDPWKGMISRCSPANRTKGRGDSSASNDHGLKV